ncbi:MAG: cellulase family glycosylhydrolase [Anaerolineales bacterium]|nr:cellulase family glycosylhydrolase [Anaerolineales bacterium]
MIKIAGSHFTDQQGRTLILRGVNLSGSSKVPSKPDGATWKDENFFDHRDVSFVGRPFPIAKADEHFSRLRAWGFTFLRLLVTWEAIEHTGPGVYDQAYLDYLYKIVKKAKEHNIQIVIDPHQDAWSRFSGGDGAPGWTFDLVGMDITKFKPTGAAIVHATHGDPFPQMIWPTNYGKYANLTMWTLFFGGNDFAPETVVDGIPIQEYLQGHFIKAIQQAANKLKDLSNVVGFGTLNEPSSGLIGIENMHQPAGQMLKGASPTPFQGMLLAAGLPQEVPVYDIGLRGMREVGRQRLNPDGVSLWKDDHPAVWRINGVWDLAENGRLQLPRQDFFSVVHGRKIEFYRDYFQPFVNRYTEAIRSIIPQTIIFVEGIPNQPQPPCSAAETENLVHAPHWYDGMTLVMKHFYSWLSVDPVQGSIIFGKNRARKNRIEQISRLLMISKNQMNNIPTLIGEIGIPFDLDKKKAYRTGIFKDQVEVLDAVIQALEANLASFTLWNYTPDNTNNRGDQWNDEDFSIFSRDQQTGTGDVHDGGRALEAAVRPYARAVAGRPVNMSFDIQERRFKFTFKPEPEIEAPTEIYLPEFQYPNGCQVDAPDGKIEIESRRLLYWPVSQAKIHSIIISKPIAQ